MEFWKNIIKELPKLDGGKHSVDSGSLCAMEMVAYMERLPHSDSPPCTCPVIASFVRTLNDSMDDSERQMLLPVLPLVVGTVNPELVTKRAEFLAEAASDRFVPMSGMDSNLIWEEAIKVLVECIELDEERIVTQWSPETAESLIREFTC